MNNETVLKMINKRIDELTTDFNSLTRSFNALNDSHHTLDKGFAEMKTEWKTTKSWIKFIFGTSLLGFIASLFTIMKMFGWI